MARFRLQSLAERIAYCNLALKYNFKNRIVIFCLILFMLTRVQCIWLFSLCTKIDNCHICEFKHNILKIYIFKIARHQLMMIQSPFKQLKNKAKLPVMRRFTQSLVSNVSQATFPGQTLDIPWTNLKRILLKLINTLLI